MRFHPYPAQPMAVVLLTVWICICMCISSVTSKPLQQGLIDPEMQPKFVTEVFSATSRDNPEEGVETEVVNADDYDHFLKLCAHEFHVQTGLVDDSGNLLSTAMYGYTIILDESSKNNQEDVVASTTPHKRIQAILAESYHPLQIQWDTRLLDATTSTSSRTNTSYLLTNLDGTPLNLESTRTAGSDYAYTSTSSATNTNANMNTNKDETLTVGDYIRDFQQNMDKIIREEDAALLLKQLEEAHREHEQQLLNQQIQQQQQQVSFTPPLMTPYLHGGLSSESTFTTSDWNVPSSTTKHHKKTIATYHNDQPAALLWMHDTSFDEWGSANTYAGLSMLYVLRDKLDTASPAPAPVFAPASSTHQEEAVFVIQDRMFQSNGELYYPTTSNSPFMGDVMTVNDKIWPRATLGPQSTRLRFLNACPHRWLVLQLHTTTNNNNNNNSNESILPLAFTLIGGDQGLGVIQDTETLSSSATTTDQRDTVIVAPASRVDMMVDLSHMAGKRIILANTAGDMPFNGKTEGKFIHNHTHHIMAFDVHVSESHENQQEPSDPWQHMMDLMQEELEPLVVINNDDDIDNAADDDADLVRKLGIYEVPDAVDPTKVHHLLGTAEPARDRNGDFLVWNPKVAAPAMKNQLLQGPMASTAPITENPRVGQTEIWELWNFASVAHPIHISETTVQVLSRHKTISEENKAIWSNHTQPVLMNDGTVSHLDLFKTTIDMKNDRNDDEELFAFTDAFRADVVTALPNHGMFVGTRRVLFWYLFVIFLQ